MEAYFSSRPLGERLLLSITGAAWQDSFSVRSHDDTLGMTVEPFILALLAALPDRKIRGKKRLQKLSYLLQQAGADLPAEFRLKHFGPYSQEIDRATSWLSLFGEVKETEDEVAGHGYLVTAYSLEAGSEEFTKPLSARISEVLTCLDRFTTVELEIAATIEYFVRREGKNLEEAVASTRRLKPGKSTAKVIQRAREALRCITK